MPNGRTIGLFPNEICGSSAIHNSFVVDEPLAMLRGGVTSFYSQDGLGTVTSLSGPGGVLRGTYQYDSFGVPKDSTDRANEYRYTARQLCRETGSYDGNRAACVNAD
jgi:hypothetical protein